MIISYMNSYVYEFIYMNSYMNSYDFFIYEFICFMNSYMNSGVPRFQMSMIHADCNKSDKFTCWMPTCFERMLSWVTKLTTNDYICASDLRLSQQQQVILSWGHDSDSSFRYTVALEQLTLLLRCLDKLPWRAFVSVDAKRDLSALS